MHCQSMHEWGGMYCPKWYKLLMYLFRGILRVHLWYGGLLPRNILPKQRHVRRGRRWVTLELPLPGIRRRYECKLTVFSPLPKNLFICTSRFYLLISSRQNTHSKVCIDCTLSEAPHPVILVCIVDILCKHNNVRKNIQFVSLLNPRMRCRLY